MMSNLAGLKKLREERFFEDWADAVEPPEIEASNVNMRQLLDDLIALGENPTEEAVRKAVETCVVRFNELDDEGWICTVEREDIFEQIGRAVDLCGFEYDEDWIGERDW